MCGLVGVVGQIDANFEKAFRTLLILDTIRGEHSTGICAVGRHAQPLVVKSVGSPFDLFETAGWDKAMRRMNRVLIGHNRYATSGNVTRANAHPFEFGHVIGAHNGTLTNHSALEDGNNFKVDSQALYHHISKHGVQDAINKVGGAWCLTWWDNEKETMNFLRNKERPLYLAISADEKTMMWASEEWMLDVVTAKHSLKMQESFFLKENTHFSTKAESQIKNLSDSFVIKEAASSYVPFVYQTGHVFRGATNQTSSTNNSGTMLTASAANNTANIQPQNNHVTSYLDEKKREKFSGSRNVKLKACGQGTDGHGGRFLYCQAPAFPEVKHPIRLYVRSILEVNDWMGKEFYGEIGELFCNPKMGMYYKIVNSSITFLSQTTEQIVTSQVQEAEKEEEETPLTMKGPRGESMTEEDWRKEFSTCAWCSDKIEPSDHFRYVSGSRDCLCSVCVSDPSLDQYVQLV